MIFFITFLRALAACLITNSLYFHIYPYKAMACGGLLGNVLFFAISGYCLCNVSKASFPVWYARRLIRMYPAVWIVTGVTFLLGSYEFAKHAWNWWVVYPTYYHFIASIACLYIPFYFLMRFPLTRDRLLWTIAGLIGSWLCVYFLYYDRSYYHIDTVREQLIRFLFMICMLIGAWFRLNDARFRDRYLRKSGAGMTTALVVALVLYFGSKFALTKYAALAPYQIGNQLILVLVVILSFIVCAGYDSKLSNLPKPFKSSISFVSMLTLEIYVVQYDALIKAWRHIAPFPLNWVGLTVSILVGAYILHVVCNWISTTCDKFLVGKKS